MNGNSWLHAIVSPESQALASRYSRTAAQLRLDQVPPNMKLFADNEIPVG